MPLVRRKASVDKCFRISAETRVKRETGYSLVTTKASLIVPAKPNARTDQPLAVCLMLRENLHDLNFHSATTAEPVQ